VPRFFKSTCLIYITRLSAAGGVNYEKGVEILSDNKTTNNVKTKKTSRSDNRVQHSVMRRDFDLIEELNRYTDKGWCINLINDDNNHWAFAHFGMQNIRKMPDGDFETTLFIDGTAFKDSIYEAWKYFADNNKLKA